jgi:hypothetical protein
MNRSNERNTFRLDAYIERCKAQGKEPREDYVNLYRGADDLDLENERNQDWKKNNLEYDLRSTDWICHKVKTSDAYAQNLYAALCNQNWQRNEVWPLLKGQTYSCSWRYAGGIIADMLEKGDYIDWYCSGIQGKLTQEQIAEALSQGMDIVRYVGEGTVTDEIRQDLFKLGWVPVDRDNDDL